MVFEEIGILQIASHYAKIRESSEGGVPEFSDAYVKSVELLRQIRTHSDFDFKPHHLFREKAPNELPSEFEYRMSIYKPATFSYWYKAVGIIQRIWNPQNWRLSFEPQDEFIERSGQTLREYLLKEFPEYKSLDEYFQQVVTPETVRDANAVLTVEPVMKEDETSFPEVVCKIYNSPKVFDFMSGSHCLILLDDDVKLSDGEGCRFLFIDSEKYVIVEQFGKKEDNAFKTVMIYEHGLKYLPARQLGGTPKKTDDNERYFLSYFYPAVPDLDRATCDSSTLDMSKYTHAFLQRWQYTQECEADGCNGGIVENFDDDGNVYKTNCSSCKGTGRRSLISPLSVMEINTPSRVDDSSKDVNIPPAGYVDVDHSILDFLKKEIEENIIAAFAILNINVSNSSVKGSDTALGKMIDREELFSFLSQVSGNLFGLYKFAAETIGRLRYGPYYTGLTVIKPTNFTIRTEKELLEELSAAPSFARRALLKSANDQRFSVHDRQNLIHDIIIRTDSLTGIPDAEIRAGVGAGIIPKWKAVLHYEIDGFIEKATEENPEFLLMSADEQRNELVAMAKAFVNSEFPSPNVAGSILDRVNAQT